MTFLTLESIKLYGVPITIDEVDLSLTQARVLVGIVEKLMDQAGHKFKRAVDLATDTFRALYKVENNRWISKKLIKIHGLTFPNKLKDVEDSMGRKRNESKKSLGKIFLDGEISKGIKSILKAKSEEIFKQTGKKVK